MLERPHPLLKSLDEATKRIDELEAELERLRGGMLACTGRGSQMPSERLDELANNAAHEAALSAPIYMYNGIKALYAALIRAALQQARDLGREEAQAEVARLGGVLAHETSRSYAERDAALAKLEAVEATLTVCELDRLDAHEAKEAAEAEVERLKLSMLAHFNEEHLAGDGPEIYKWQRKLAEAQQQTQDMILERDQLLDVQKGLEAEVGAVRAALQGMVVKLVEGLSCGTGPADADAMPLSEREREIVKGILKLARAALDPEVK